MKRYALLLNPGHNRVYFNSAGQVCLLELLAVVGGTDIDVPLVRHEVVAGIDYIVFETGQELSDCGLRNIGRLSSFFALFEIVEDRLFLPVLVDKSYCFFENINSILKYVGKTNEQFTRLMINLAVAACKTNGQKYNLLDPLAGKGTTLYEAVTFGFDVAGVEIDSAWHKDAQMFFVKYLENGKYKHKLTTEKRSDKDGKKIADVFNVVFADAKDKYNSGETQTMKFFCADTKNTNLFFRKKSFDMIVTDLPYGVQHASKKGKQLSRNAVELIEIALPSWKQVLKSGGSIVMSFNEFTTKKSELSKVLEDNGFVVLNESPYDGYIHRVDQSINRDLIVGVLKEI